MKRRMEMQKFLADFEEYQSDKCPETILYDKEHDITIDRFVYTKIVDAVRQIHGFKRNNQIPANERTKMDLIDDARDEAMMAAQKEYLTNLCGVVPMPSEATVELLKQENAFDKHFALDDL
jgi:hypothetical protein